MKQSDDVYKFERLLPNEIEKRSFEIISHELAIEGICLPLKNTAVIQRVIHATADFDYVKNLYFSQNAVSEVLHLLEGSFIITDTKMSFAGISETACKKLNIEKYCFISDADVAVKAKKNGFTRSETSMDKAAQVFAAKNFTCQASSIKKLIFAIGNAPTALIRLDGLIRENRLNPVLIIAAPVGFVNVEAAKELIIKTAREFNIHCICARGKKGGSAVAAAICNALLYKKLSES